MIKKIITKRSLDHAESLKDDLLYWRSRSADERIGAVEDLRRQYYGSSTRLQRTAKVIQRSQS